MAEEEPRTPAALVERHDGACACALRYLAAMEARDLDTARRLIADDAELVFPGGVRRRDLAAIVAGSAARYRSIGKQVAGCDLALGPDGTEVVYVRGSLYGQWPDGRSFDDIRFIDRFEIRDGVIRRQEVWNDSGERRLRDG